MRRDPKAFRERFAAWKKGKDVYKDGRPTDLYLDTMEGVARNNAANWGVSEDEALLHAMNDNSYNYQGYYDKYPESAADSRSHWTDEFKTVYHPTFSNESQYHGKQSKYNPSGLRGGMWIGDKFQPATWQSKAKALRLNKIGYTKGKDSLPGYSTGEDGGFINWMKNALIGASVADAPAVATASGWKQDNNGNWVQERTPESTQLANNLSVLSTFSPTHPANAILNGAFSLAGKSVKAANSVFRNAFKLNKPVIQPLGGASIDYSLPGGKDLLVKGLYREAILGESIGSPHAVVNPNMKQIPSWAVESIQNSTIPRMVLMKKELPPEQLAEWIKNSVGKEYGEFSGTAYKLAGKENFDGFYNPRNDFVSIKRGSADWALLHELRHKIDLHIPLSPEEVQILKEAFTDDFLSLSSTVDRFKDLDLSKEMVTTNGDIRRLLLGDQVDWSASIDKQNELIDAARDIDIIDALQHANGYGREYYNLLIDKYGEVPKKIISALRNSMKKIGVGTGVAAGANELNEGYKHGKDSGIHIKPENRGKFTALKKRTGKSASWFKAHGTPALKKMATFALNASKWKH